MSIERILTTAGDSWAKIVNTSRAVFGGVEYARIYQEYTGFEARLYSVEYGDVGTLSVPFFVRPVGNLPFVSSSENGFFDTLTPEYTGPIACGEISTEFANDFVAHFEAYCRKQGIVAEFAHLHPWNWSPKYLEPSCVSVDREIVYIDLTLNDSQLWEKSFTHACRKNIKRSRNENIRTVEAVNVGDIKEFHRVYTQTMDRNLASDKYYYPLEYFVAFFEQMPNNARFVLAIKQDQVIAGTLYLHDDTDVYSYLGGADQLFQQARPTNAVVYDTIAWARQSGKKRIILGGGYKPDDGIFRFKASFSPLRAQFRIYKRIHLSQTYDNLCKTWVEYYNLPIEGTYFPAYRALPATITGVANSADHVSVEEDAWKR